MKTFLVIIVLLLALVSVVQNHTIVAQHTTIMEMRMNPACMIAPTSSPNPLPGRRTI